MSSLARRIWNWLATGVAAVVILLAVVLGLFRVMLPQVPAYHQQIEGWASRAIGLPVRIDRIDARWGLGGPELYFSGARVLSPDGGLPLIEADTGSVSISVLGWLRNREIRPDQVTLDRTRLKILRSRDGIYHLQGLAPGSAQDRESDERFSLDVIPSGRFELLNAQISFQDLDTEHGPLSFFSPGVNIENNDDKLALAGVIDLPGALGQALEFSGEMVGELDRPDSLDWQIYVQGNSLNLAGWRDLFPQSEFIPAAGLGAVELWVAFGGPALQQASLNVNLADLRLRGQEEGSPSYQKLSGRFQLDRTAAGWRAIASDLLVQRDGLTWPRSAASMEWSEERARRIIYADASFARLDDLMPLVPLLPEELRTAIGGEYVAWGDLRDMVLHYRERDGAPAYSVQVTLDNVGFLGPEAKPSVYGITGSLRASERGGRFRLDSTGSNLAIPAILRSPIGLRSASGDVSWETTQAGTALSAEALSLESDDFSALATLSFWMPSDGRSPELELDARLKDVDVAATKRYLPSKVMRPKLVAWMDKAFLAGRATEGEVRFHGPLDEFPFDESDGEFTVRMDVTGGALRYADRWPPLTDLEARLEIKNASLTIEGRQPAGLDGGHVETGRAYFEDLRTADLQVAGAAFGTLPDLLSFLRSSPLKEYFGPKLGDVQGDGGQCKVEMELFLPLRHIADYQAVVDTSIDNGALGLVGVPHRLEALKGSVLFSDGRLTAQGMTAQLFEDPVSIDIGPHKDDAGGTVATVTGWIEARDLIGRLGLPLEGRIEGEAVWQAQALFTRAEAQGVRLSSVGVETSLEGLAVTLPEPLAKSKDETVPVSFELDLSEEGRIDMHADWGSVVTGVLDFRRGADAWRFYRGALQIGEGVARIPLTEGLIVRGDIEELRADEWLELKSGGEGRPLSSFLNAIDLTVGELLAFGYRFQGVELNLERASREWVVQLDSPTIKGSLFVPFDDQLDLPLSVDMERLYLNEKDSREPGQADPRSLPGLRVSVEDFMLGGRKFGRIYVEGTRTAQGLSFPRISSEADSFRIQGAGTWAVDSAGEQTHLNVELVSNDVLLTLSDLGYGNSIEATSGQAIMNVHWPGSPGSDFLPKISGDVSVSIEDGQLNDVEPGAGRVFGLLSIAALPRRLGLDFRDVFRKGFRFDEISGDFVLDAGNAYTANLRLDGPAAEIGVAGRAGLADRDYDQTAIVSAKIGKTLPVAGALAAGAGVGAALLLFSEIFKEPLKGIARVHYRISGSWDEPTIERVLARDVPEEEEASAQ